MKKLDFLNGSLLPILLSGGTIVAIADDGIDYHVIMRQPDEEQNKTRDEIELPKFTKHETKVYANGSMVFVQTDEYYENLKIVRSVFEDSVKAESIFKSKYPRNNEDS